MNFEERRGSRGAFRATPEEILRQAIAAHRALRERERWQADQRPGGDMPRAKPAPGRTTEEGRRRAQFAAAMARATFGRFYRKDSHKVSG